MTTFDDREQAFERKFAHQEKVDFAIEARTCKLFGLWAAEKLGITGDAATTYAQSVVAANLKEAGFDDILGKVRKDLKDMGVEVSDHLMNVELDKALAEARKQIQNS